MVLVLFVVSLCALFSSSQGDMTKVVTQAKHFVVALILMCGVAKIPLGYLSRLALPLYLLAIVFIVLSELIGVVY